MWTVVDAQSDDVYFCSARFVSVYRATFDAVIVAQCKQK